MVKYSIYQLLTFLLFSFEKEPWPSVIFFKPNLFRIFSNGKNSPNGTSFCLLYSWIISRFIINNNYTIINSRFFFISNLFIPSNMK